MKIKGIVALVSGGGSGMGAAVVKSLSAQGAKVCLIDTNDEHAQKVAQSTNSYAIVCDVTCPDQVGQSLDKLEEHFGEAARICINCAGIAPAMRIVGREGPLSLEAFNRVIQVNLLGTFNVMRLAAAKMMSLQPIDGSQERGVIINTASIAAYEGQIGQAAYSASKGGVVSLTLPAAREFAKFGIRVNTIAPGLIATPMLLNMPDEVVQSLTSITQFPKRLGKPEEFAKLSLHIIENELINGTVIRLDGAVRLAAK